MTARDRQLLAEVADFQALEIGLLQAGRYDDWLKLFTSDVRYWMPTVAVTDRREDSLADDHGLAYYDDNWESLSLRVRRALSKSAWTERPFSRFRYFVQPLAVERRNEAEVAVASNLLAYQTRLQDEENFFVGGRDDVLRRLDGEWKIAYRKIVIDRSVLPSKNLTIFF